MLAYCFFLGPGCIVWIAAADATGKIFCASYVQFKPSENLSVETIPYGRLRTRLLTSGAVEERFSQGRCRQNRRVCLCIAVGPEMPSERVCYIIVNEYQVLVTDRLATSESLTYLLHIMPKHTFEDHGSNHNAFGYANCISSPSKTI
jgi:hypothetical protein